MSKRSATAKPEIFARLDDDEPIVIAPGGDGAPEQVHVFDDEKNRSRLAIKAALAAGRPLLVRGDPGVGKTQLAAAAAIALGRPLISYVVDSRSEARDLLWRFDAVRRLGEAQICGVLQLQADQVFEQLHVSRFVEPGPLWWGFDWESAKAHCVAHKLDSPPVRHDTDPDNGRVVLIDEIDKAESDLPNGLLEALGSGRFHPDGCREVSMQTPSPLVVVTTNEERVLPDAFVRLCLVLQLELPEDEASLTSLLIERGQRHFPDASDKLLSKAAGMLYRDRLNSRPPRPGQAEYFDLVRAVRRLTRHGADEDDLLERISEFTLKKQTGPAR